MSRLTIAICTLPSRLGMLSNLVHTLLDQISIYDLQNDVEILYLGDNKGMTVGFKRNELVGMATGDYISFVDDDDSVVSSYIWELIKVIGSKPNIDVITFNVGISVNGAPAKPVYYSKDFLKDSNHKDHYKRIPNHLMCFRRDLVLSTPYENISFQEDAIWAKHVLPKIQTEYNIDKQLYIYNCNHATSETLPDELKKKLLKKNT